MRLYSDFGRSDNKLLFSRYMLGIDYSDKAESEIYRCYVILLGVIREFLTECRININSKGYLYIQDSIIAIIDQRTMDIRFKTDVYPYVAFKYGVKDSSNVEHSIRNALVAAYKLNELDENHSSAIMSSFGRCPTNKTFLLYMTREVCRRLWDESIEFTDI